MQSDKDIYNFLLIKQLQLPQKYSDLKHQMSIIKDHVTLKSTIIMLEQNS